MKYLILFFLSFSIYASCFTKITALLKKYPNQGAFQITHTDPQDLAGLVTLFKEVKTLQMTFRHYMDNQSPLKRKLTPEEIKFIKNHFSHHINNLNDSYAADYYANYLMKILYEIDEAYRITLVKNKEDGDDQYHRYLAKVLMTKYNFNNPAKGQDQVDLEFYDNYKYFNPDELQFLKAFYKEEDLEKRKELIKDIPHSLYFMYLQLEDLRVLKSRNYCCTSPGGCTECPNNLRFININMNKDNS